MHQNNMRSKSTGRAAIQRRRSYSKSSTPGRKWATLEAESKPRKQAISPAFEILPLPLQPLIPVSGVKVLKENEIVTPPAGLPRPQDIVRSPSSQKRVINEGRTSDTNKPVSPETFVVFTEKPHKTKMEKLTFLKPDLIAPNAPESDVKCKYEEYEAARKPFVADPATPALNQSLGTAIQNEGYEHEQSIMPEAPAKKPSVQWQSNVWKGVGKPHFTCDVCQAKFNKKFEFTAHTYKHRVQQQKEADLTCATCLVKFHRDEVLQDHYYRGNHGQGSFVINQNGEEVLKKYSCEKCQSALPAKYHFEKHMEMHRKPKQTCPYLRCTQTFDHEFEVTEHVTEVHEQTSKRPKIELVT